MSYENSDGGGGGVMMGDVGEEEEVKVAPAAIVFALGSFLGSLSLGASGFGNAIAFLFVYQMADMMGLMRNTGHWQQIGEAVRMSTVMSAATLPILVVHSRAWRHVLRGTTNADESPNFPPALKLLIVLLIFTAIASPPGNILGTVLNGRVVKAIAAGFLLISPCFGIARSCCARVSRRWRTQQTKPNAQTQYCALVKTSSKGVHGDENGDVEREGLIGNGEGHFDNGDDDTPTANDDDDDDTRKQTKMEEGKDGEATTTGTDEEKEVVDADPTLTLTTTVTTKVLIVAAFTGIATGIMGGIASLRGPPAMIFFSYYTFPPSMTRAIGTWMGFVNVSFRVIYYIVSKSFGAHEFWVSASVVVAGIAGLVVGIVCHERIKGVGAVKRIFSVLLLLSAASLLISAISGNT